MHRIRRGGANSGSIQSLIEFKTVLIIILLIIDSFVLSLFSKMIKGILVMVLASSIGHAMGLGYQWKLQKPGEKGGKMYCKVNFIFIVCFSDLPYICTLPAETGPYQPFAPMIRYFYNYKTGQCEPFYYGGYEGNANRFNTLEECQQCCPSVNSKSCPTGSRN